MHTIPEDLLWSPDDGPRRCSHRGVVESSETLSGSALVDELQNLLCDGQDGWRAEGVIFLVHPKEERFHQNTAGPRQVPSDVLGSDLKYLFLVVWSQLRGQTCVGPLSLHLDDGGRQRAAAASGAQTSCRTQLALAARLLQEHRTRT